MKYTKWEITEEVYITDGIEYVAEVVETNENRRDNARLIAAAPELLEALQACLGELAYIDNAVSMKLANGDYVEVDYAVIAKASNAIKKAAQ